MTPSAVMMNRNPDSDFGNSANLYNSISSAGNPELSKMEQSEESIQQNPAEMAIANFGRTFESVQSLLEDPNYSFASKEADLVKRALQNWLEAVVTGLSVQGGMGGESLQAQGATPPY